MRKEEEFRLASEQRYAKRADMKELARFAVILIASVRPGAARERKRRMLPVIAKSNRLCSDR
jgi:hypothetical protein